MAPEAARGICSLRKRPGFASESRRPAVAATGAIRRMMPTFAKFPSSRPRRLRRSERLRRMVRETALQTSDLIWPIFVCEGQNATEPVPSMPGVDRVSLDLAVGCAEAAAELGVAALAVFPHTPPKRKSEDCREAWNPENLANSAIRLIKAAVPDLPVMLDVALDPYNSLGHDGIVRDGAILNDETLGCLVRQAREHAIAGADILGPSDMMDGRIGKIREMLESEGFPDTVLLSYSAKYASAFYAPFRDAVGSSGALAGDKKTYQMDPSNSDEAVRMVQRLYNTLYTIALLHST